MGVNVWREATRRLPSLLPCRLRVRASRVVARPGSRGLAATRRQLAVGPAVRVSHCPQEARRPLAPRLSLVLPPARGDRLGGMDSLTSIGSQLLPVVRSPERTGSPHRDPLPRGEPHTPSERSGAAGSDPDLNWVPGTGGQLVHGGRPSWEPRAPTTAAHWSSGTDGGLSSRGRGFDPRMRYGRQHVTACTCRP